MLLSQGCATLFEAVPSTMKMDFLPLLWLPMKLAMCKSICIMGVSDREPNPKLPFFLIPLQLMLTF